MQEQPSVSWAQGVDAVYDRRELARAKLVFVTPPVKGWTLVAGWWAMGQGDRHSLENIVTIVRDLSSSFGEAQDLHPSELSNITTGCLQGTATLNGASLKQGEVLANTGPITEAERKLALSSKPAEQWTPNENDVVTVATGWSVDPTKLATDSGPAESGVIGRIRKAE